MNGQIISYTPAGAVPPSEKAGLQYSLDMAVDAIRYHEEGDETDPACCTGDNPCQTRIYLVGRQRDLAKKIQTARTSSFGGQIEETPRQTSGGSSQATRQIVADPASEAQIRYIKGLIEQRETSKIGTYPTRTMNEIQAGSEVSKSRASGLITALKNALPKIRTSAPEIQTPATPAVQIPRPNRVTEDGMYRTPDGEIYKVQVAVHGSGHLYAKKLVELDEPKVGKTFIKTHDFEMESGAIRRLIPEMKMTLEEAKKWGALYGSCCRCGKTLTKEKSIEAGIGPVCAGKF